jgi:hypothetical protein
MSGRTSGKEKQQSPQRCPKCGATANLTVSVTVVPDGSSVLGGRVVWDNDTATKCGACGFIGKVADFEPTDSYSPENEAEWEKIARGDYDLRCQPRGDPIEDETEIKRITDALRRAYPRGQDNEPKASPGPEENTYGFDIEAERRREAGFRDEIRRRWEAGMAKKEEMANAEPVLATPAIYPLAALSFREAKTMPEAPHEYVVRTPENEAAYVALFTLIVEHGVAEKWRGRRYQYFYPGDGWKYWRMTNNIRQSRVLNRCRVVEAQGQPS